MHFSLVTKLSIALSLGTAIVLSAYGWLAVRRELDLFDRSKREHGLVLGKVLAAQVAATWSERGGSQLDNALRYFDSPSTRVRWVSVRPDDVAGTHGLVTEALKQLHKREPVSLLKDTGDGPVVATYIPVPVQGPDGGAIEILESLTDSAAYTKASVRRLAVAFCAAIFVNGFVAFLLSSWLVGRPIDKLVAKAGQVGRGDYEVPLDISRRDEIGVLAQAMRDMAKALGETRSCLQKEEDTRRKTEQDLRHAERLTIVGKLAAGVAHELGTPLNVIAGKAKRIMRKTEDEEIVKDLTTIREQSERITQIVRQLLDFSRRKETPSAAEVSVGQFFTGIVDLLRTAIRNYHGVELVQHAPKDELCVHADTIQLQQVLSNLVLNAAQSMPSGGRIELGAEAFVGTPPVGSSSAHGSYVRIFVRDEGHGIPSAIKDRIFEPFFTTKDVGEGTGLGLSVVYGIVKDHGGVIDAQSEVGSGTCFSIFLPRRERAQVSA